MMNTLNDSRAVPIALRVNGSEVSAQVEPRLHLADFLRERLRLTGTHLGCEHGVCGACTVLVDDVPVRSCITYAVSCDGLNVRTIEGFEQDKVMTLLRETFSREHGLQCGFCTPGMMITSRDIVQRLPNATERDVRIELSGNLCRCTGYKGIVQAVCAALAEKPASQDAPLPKASALAARPREFAAFAPTAVGPSVTVPAAATAPESLATSRKGWTRVEESFAIALPPDRVWRAFLDLPLLAACLPGAELEEHDATSAKGRISVKLGPIVAAFSGAAIIERDEATLSGLIKGAGSDKRSGSRTRGELAYRLIPDNGGKSTKIAATIDYALQGVLAQFSRSGVAQEMGRIMVAQFAANLSSRLGADSGVSVSQGDNKIPIAGQPVSAWKIMWRALLNSYRGADKH